MEQRSAYMDQKSREDDHQQVDLPIHRKVVRTVISRGRTDESMGKGGCMVRVKRGGKDRGRGVDGEGDGGGSGDVTNGVCGIGLGGFEERGESKVVVGVKEVDEDGNEGGEYVVDIHGGRMGVAHCRMWWEVVVEVEDAEIENGQDGQV